MAKPYERKLLLRLILIPMSFAVLGWLIVHQYYWVCILASLFIFYLLFDIYRYQIRIYRELEQFKEAIHYRDFSRHFDVERAPAELRPLREYFNSINDSFKDAAKEKETQYQYLQQILSIVETGILSYNLSDGNIVWMNEAIKNLLNLPHFKNIRSLEKRNELLLTEIESVGVGESKLLSLPQAKKHLKILLSATAFQVDQQKFKLITFQNINEAIEETEAEAWSRLLGVMTHEIMNSIAPISSLAETLKKLVEESIRSNEHQPSYQEDLQTGIETIRKRSESLLKFANTYRNLNKITTLNLQKILVRELFENQSNLLAPTLAAKNIELEIILKDPSVQLQADLSLLEQVLINLILNAIDAVKATEKPKIILSAEIDIHKKCVIKVTDNGPGIPPEVIDKMFIPFFSTKKLGSGIGLNLCKQIVMLHKGVIQVETIENVGTSLILIF